MRISDWSSDVCSSDLLAQSKAALGARAEAADKTLGAARAKAMGEIERVAADAATQIVEKLTGTRPDADTATGAARAALAKGSGPDAAFPRRRRWPCRKRRPRHHPRQIARASGWAIGGQ